MNVYDFDGTIYDGDSSIDFYLFCIKKNIKLIKFLPFQIKGLFLYIVKKYTKEQYKSCFFSFISKIDNLNEYVFLFWNRNEKKIKRFYLRQYKKDDCIISASPFFLLVEICNRLNIYNLIATEVDSKTGLLLSENCHDYNKPIFFRKKFCDTQIDEFYSDSYTDEPMMRLAKKAFIVKQNSIIEWK